MKIKSTQSTALPDITMDYIEWLEYILKDAINRADMSERQRIENIHLSHEH